MTATIAAPDRLQACRAALAARTDTEARAVTYLLDETGLWPKLAPFVTSDGGICFGLALGDLVEGECHPRCTVEQHHVVRDADSEPRRADSCPVWWNASCLSSGERRALEFAAALWDGRPVDVVDALTGTSWTNVLVRALQIRLGGG